MSLDRLNTPPFVPTTSFGSSFSFNNAIQQRQPLIDLTREVTDGVTTSSQNQISLTSQQFQTSKNSQASQILHISQKTLKRNADAPVEPPTIKKARIGMVGATFKALRIMMNNNGHDLIINVQNVKFNCHCALIRAQSVYLGNKLHNLSKTAAVQDLDISDCTSQGFSEAHKVMYGILPNITAQNFIDVYATALLLRLKSLEELCTASFDELLKPQTALTLLESSQKNPTSQEFFSKVCDYTAINIAAVNNSQSVDALSKESFIALLENDKLNLQEFDVFKQALLWLLKQKEPLQDWTNVKKQIRFEHMQSDDFNKVVDAVGHFNQTKGCELFSREELDDIEKRIKNFSPTKNPGRVPRGFW